MSVHPVLSSIVAKSRNGVIGKDGGLPWHISSDLKLFKATTMGKPVLMGRVTFEGLKQPLPERPNLVLTRNEQYQAKGAEVFTDLHAMIGRGFELAGEMGTDEIMIIGGANVFAQTLPYVHRVYVSEVDAMIDGDAHFPALSTADWRCVSEQEYPKGPKDDFPFTFRIYQRIGLKS